MEVFRTEEYAKTGIPDAEEYYRRVILSDVHRARNLGGIFCQLLPGAKLPYHYHKNRESIIILISGEGVEIVDDRETNIKAGDVLYIPAGEKHMMVNRSKNTIRYLEFFTPTAVDIVQVTPGNP